MKEPVPYWRFSGKREKASDMREKMLEDLSSGSEAEQGDRDDEEEEEKDDKVCVEPYYRLHI